MGEKAEKAVPFRNQARMFFGKISKRWKQAVKRSETILLLFMGAPCMHEGESRGAVGGDGQPKRITHWHSAPREESGHKEKEEEEEEEEEEK